MKKLSTDWSDVYDQQPWETIDVDLKTNSVTLSGFSSGGYQVSNLLAIFSDQLDGGAIISGGGPCATRNWCWDKQARNYSTNGLINMPVFLWGGNNDEVVPIKEIKSTQNWFE